MKYTQNEKILQIKETTLIVGIDVGSEKHYARAFNFRGVECGKLLIFENNVLITLNSPRCLAIGKEKLHY
jgi:transposase